MIKKYQKKIYTGIYFFIFLCVGFFCLPISKTLADLEVQYPEIAGQTLSASSKLPDFALYLFNFGMEMGFVIVFISLAVAGVMYFLAPVSAQARAIAKDRVTGAVSGLLILLLTYLILTTINPALKVFTLTPLPPAPTITTTPPAVTKAPGVYFYKSGCSDNSVQPSTASIPDLGELKNNVKSAGIVQDTDNGIYYISILYENPNFSGKCLYLDPKNTCQPTNDPQTGKPFASSASVYKYDPSPGGDGVYFYRKSYFDTTGGYYKVPKSQITGKIYIHKLDDPNNPLKFTGNGNSDCTVPKEEQDCVKYDKNGKCADADRRCPTLGGENISSIKISGNYLVLLVYFGPNDASYGPWTSCQEFPTINDVNKSGPQQIKWQNIRNGSAIITNNGKTYTTGVIPNYIVIIPIK